jgi:hypothetical protein
LSIATIATTATTATIATTATTATTNTQNHPETDNPKGSFLDSLICFSFAGTAWIVVKLIPDRSDSIFFIVSKSRTGTLNLAVNM